MSPASLVVELGGLGLSGCWSCGDLGGGRAWPQLAANSWFRETPVYATWPPADGALHILTVRETRLK